MTIREERKKKKFKLRLRQTDRHARKSHPGEKRMELKIEYSRNRY